MASGDTQPGGDGGDATSAVRTRVSDITLTLLPGRFLGGRWKLAAAVLSACAGFSCSALAPNAPQVDSHAFDQPLLTELGQRYLPRLASAPGQSGFRLLVSGQEAFAARAALAESAQRALDLQYYIVDDDATATVLLEATARAARRGVRVRLLVDDLNAGAHEGRLSILSGQPNVEVRLFNPFATRGSFGLGHVLELLGDGKRLNRRMHNKAWIADGAVAVVGGRNLSDAYFNAAPGSDFADLDVLATGPVVGDMSRSFDHYWNSAWSIPIAAVGSPVPPRSEQERTQLDVAAQATDFRTSEYVRELRKMAFRAAVRSGQVSLVMAPAQVFYNVPPDPSAAEVATPSEVFTALRGAIENAKREVVMVSPYLVPGEKGRELLCALAARRVRVRVLTNSLASTDVAVVHAGYARHRPQLVACGVHLYELRPQGAATSATRIGLSSGARLHSKAIVVDGQIVFIGSMNLDPRSRQLNTELALRIDSDELARQITGLFNEATAPDQAFHVGLDPPGSAQARVHWDAVEDGKPVRYTREPLASAWLRWVLPLLGALAPEELL